MRVYYFIEVLSCAFHNFLDLAFVSIHVDVFRRFSYKFSYLRSCQWLLASGNKLFQGRFISAIYGSPSPYVVLKWNLLNSGIALIGTVYQWDFLQLLCLCVILVILFMHEPGPGAGHLLCFCFMLRCTRLNVPIMLHPLP